MGAAGYAPDLDLPQNKDFVKSLTPKRNVLPGGASASGYNAAEAIVRTIAAVDGKIEDKERFLAALRKVRFDSPSGVFRFDAKQNTIHDMYLLKNVKQGNRIVPHMVELIASDVDQFWHRN